MLSSTPSSTLNLLFWSGLDTIINACDLMQNLGQTRVFYKPGQTRLTHDLVGLVDLDDPIRFQPDIHPIKLSVNFRIKSYSD